MKKSKLITLLSVFSKEEMKRFEKFLASPYFNNERNFKPLYNILKSYHPGFDSPDFSEENLYKELYPGKTYDKKSSASLRVLISQMTAMAEKFMSYESMEGDGKIIVNRALNYFLIRKGLFEESLKGFNKSNEKLKEFGIDCDYYYNLIINNTGITSSYQGLNKQNLTGVCNNKISLYFLAFQFCRLSNIINNIIFFERRYKEKTLGLEFFAKIVDAFDPEHFEKEFSEDEIGTKQLTLMYYYICKSLLKNNENKSLETAIFYFKKSIDNLKINGAQSVFARVHNICRVRAYEVDYQLYGKIDHKLSEFVWSKGFYKWNEDAVLLAVAYDSVFEFKIAFLNASELKSFADKFVPELSKDAQEAMRNYSYAWVNFKEKRFDKALELISKINIVDISFKDNLYKLKTASLFELGFFEEALMTVDAYEHYLNNNKNVFKDTLAMGKRFSQAIRKLIKSKCNLSENFDSDLTKLVEENKNSLFGKWFEMKSLS